MMFGRTRRKEGSPTPTKRFWLRKRVLATLAIIAVAIYALWHTEIKKDAPSSATTFAVRKGNLDIAVIEGGSVEALESQTIKSQIKGQTKILTIVDEGYLVTPDDVKNKKVLVTLDNSDLQDKLTQEEFEYQGALANYTDGKEQYEIQLKQNDSDIKSAELDVRFASMDFEKYLGAELATKITTSRGLDIKDVMDRLSNEDLEDVQKAANEKSAADKSASEQQGGDVPAETTPGSKVAAAPQAKADAVEVDPLADDDEHDPASIVSNSLQPIDFTQYASSEKLGDGAAQQSIRKLASDRLLAEESLGLSQTQLAGTRRLAEKNFVTKQDLDNDEMKVKQNTVTRDSAMTAEDLFIHYEFPKEAERLLSVYEEGIRKLERTKRQAIAKAAQALAHKNTTEASFKLHERRRQDLKDQIAACTIVAERSGLVVYAGSDNPWRDQDRIQPGADIREFQELITIPDMAQMAVKVKVHESAIKQIQKGQKAKITLDAYPDEKLTGEVMRISVLPDSNQRWMSPDTKVYPCIVSIDGTHEWLKPSMTAQVEVEVKELKDVVYVPIQAVFPDGNNRVCYVVDTLGGSTQRIVETGEMNNEFIEIKKGLQEGEHVMLRAPNADVGDSKDKKDKDKKDDDQKGATKGDRQKRQKQ